MGDSLPTNLVLYDGICGLCNRFVQHLLRQDSAEVLSFAPLQGSTAEQVRTQHPSLPVELSTVGYLREGELLLRSRAVFAIWYDLGGAWKVLAAFRFLPRVLTDLGYRAVASVRYRIWGKLDACRIPDPDQAARFLD
ncbi:MAG: DCC1-like thiol-disulfide oxidoreductase family protein [Myxococcota bacterium]|nr:DCC1-like thiol-disulfide oxidoreductase family protein [Myxococcota bacterium]